MKKQTHLPERPAVRYIAIIGLPDCCWGKGKTMREATNNAKKQLGPPNTKVYGSMVVYKFVAEYGARFYGKPHDGNPPEGYADCWVDEYGAINWINCIKDKVVQQPIVR